MKEKNLKHKFILILFSLAAFLPSLGLKDPDVMEARNFVTAREMVLHNNWLIPTMNGVYRFEKPPFPTWITAATMKLFGDTSTEWILRLPAVLMSVLFILMLYSFINFLTKKSKLAFITSLIAVSTSFFMEEGVANTWDIFSYVAAFGYILFVTKGLQTKEIKYFILSSIPLGISILSKGPVAIYGLVLPFFIAYGIIYGVSKLKENWINILISFILGVLIGSSWYIYMMIFNKELFLQVMDKEVDTWDSRSVKGFFFYFNFLRATGVWVIFAIASLLVPLKTKSFNQENKNLYYLGLIWTFVSLLLLSFIKMKKERYAIPLYMVTPLFIAPILYYLSSLIFDKMGKIFKHIVIAHWIIIFIINTSLPFLFYFRGVKSKIIPFKVIIIYILIAIIFDIILLILAKKRHNVDSFYKLIIITGVIGIIFFHSKEKMLEISRLKKQKVKLPFLSVLQNETNLPPIHSEDVFIEEIWAVGRNINFSLDNLEPEFIYMSLTDNIDINKFKEYTIVKKEIMYRSKNGQSKVFLYWLKK